MLTQLNSTQLNSTQLNSTQLNSTQLNSTQLNSTQLQLTILYKNGSGYANIGKNDEIFRQQPLTAVVGKREKSLWTE